VTEFLFLRTWSLDSCFKWISRRFSDRHRKQKHFLSVKETQKYLFQGEKQSATLSLDNTNHGTYVLSLPCCASLSLGLLSASNLATVNYQELSAFGEKMNCGIRTATLMNDKILIKLSQCAFCYTTIICYFFNPNSSFQTFTIFLSCNGGIVMIDSITKLCLSLFVCTNGLSYSGEETPPTLCIKATPNRSGVRYEKQNKHQLLHRIQSVRTVTNLQ